MDESKNPSQKMLNASVSTEKLPQEPAQVVGGKRGFAKEVLISIAANYLALPGVPLAALIWLYLSKDPIIPWWVIVFVLVMILLGYLALISLQYFFGEDVIFKRRWKVHLTLLALFIVIVTAPLAMMQSFANARAKELVALQEKLKNEIESTQQTQQVADSTRIQLYAHVTDSMKKILSEPNINASTLRDLLTFCITSVSLNKPQVRDLRAAVFYLDESGDYLVVPQHGYAGYTLDEDITGLDFKISRRLETETEESYRQRLGVAGWSYVSGKPILDDDVQATKPGEEHQYKRFPASQKEQADRSMICVGIPDLKNGREDRNVGILAISSLSPDVFSPNDLAIARFFAILLSRFKTPIETPKSLK